MNNQDLFPIDDNHLSDLKRKLAHTADERGTLEVAYRIVDSPVGQLLLAATNKGLVRVAFENENFDAVLDSIASKVSPRVLELPEKLDTAAFELEEYFAGTRRTFDLPLDHSLSSGFRLIVQSLLPEIAFGETRTYKEVAELVGNPKAVRAVGTACATNPLPVVVPCHRVLRTDGGLGGYIGGLDAKRTLLNLERAA